MCYSLFNHSPIEHLGCFQFGAIIKKAAMNICEQVLYAHMFSFPLGKYAGVELLGGIVNVYLPS